MAEDDYMPMFWPIYSELRADLKTDNIEIH